jgi:hypothetical protein
MNLRVHIFAAVLLLFSGIALAQEFAPNAADGPSAMPPARTADVPAIAAPVALPRMAPELALQVYHGRAVIQSSQLAGYSAETLIRAELPETSQKGEFELQRRYSAPRNLEFTAVRYTGDGFVKSNVITRLLQSEVEHVKQEDGSRTAISKDNYKFSYKGTGRIGERLVHIYQVKPRNKRAGLFKGRIYLDAYTGSMVRAEGGVVKSPSFFIRKIEFIQDYVDVGEFTFPTHIHSEALARVIGRTVVDIYQQNYKPITARLEAARVANSVIHLDN